MRERAVAGSTTGEGGEQLGAATADSTGGSPDPAKGLPDLASPGPSPAGGEEGRRRREEVEGKLEGGLR